MFSERHLSERPGHISKRLLHDKKGPQKICLCRRGPTAQFIFRQTGGHSLLAVCGPDSQHLHCQLGRLPDSREDGLDRRGRTSKPRGNDQRARHQLYGGATSPGFIFVQHWVFSRLLTLGNLLFGHASTNATDDHKYSLFPSKILPFPKLWYLLAYSFSFSWKTKLKK